MAVPDQGCIDRVYAKGTTLWVRAQKTSGTTSVPCQWDTAFKLAGVKSINGPSLKRSGDVDATELAPAPGEMTAQAAGVIPADNAEEHFYWTGQCPGTKKVDPIKLELNMQFAAYKWLITRYTNSDLFSAFLLFRNGDRLYFDPTVYVASMDMTIAENSFIQTPVELQTSYRVLYVPSGTALPAGCLGVTS